MNDEHIFPDDARSRHLYIAGLPGQGKSSEMFAMALQDMRRGAGITVLDPKADLVKTLLHWIPRDRVKDVIYLSAETPVPINIFAHVKGGRSALAQDVYTLFGLIIGELGDRMGPVLKWTIHALIDAGGCSFFDIYDFLAKKDEREKILKRVSDPEIKHFWEVQFLDPYYRGSEPPLVSRLVDFVLMPELRSVCGNPEATLTMSDIVEGNKILLVNLASFGKLGAQIIGTLITSQIQQVILRRMEMPEALRHPYFVYADEFHEFKNAAFNEILWKSRGFKLGLVLATQHPIQIKELLDDVKGCITSFLLFQMDADHARVLKSRLGDITPEQVSNLPEYTALYRSSDRMVRIIPTHKRPEDPTQQQKEKAQSIRLRMMSEYPCNPISKPHNKGNVLQPEPTEPQPTEVKSEKRKIIPPKKPHTGKSSRTPR